MYLIGYWASDRDSGEGVCQALLQVVNEEDSGVGNQACPKTTVTESFQLGIWRGEAATRELPNDPGRTETAHGRWTRRLCPLALPFTHKSPESMGVAQPAWRNVSINDCPPPLHGGEGQGEGNDPVHRNRFTPHPDLLPSSRGQGITLDSLSPTGGVVMAPMKLWVTGSARPPCLPRPWS